VPIFVKLLPVYFFSYVIVTSCYILTVLQLTTPHRKNQFVTKCYTVPRIAGSCEHGNEPSGAIKGGEFLD